MPTGAIDPRAIERDWPLTGVEIMGQFEAYRTRAVTRLRAEEGEFVAKCDPHADSLRVSERLELVERLRATGYRHAPAVVRTRTGAMVARWHSQTVWILECVPFPLTADGRPDPQVWEELGTAGARLNGYHDERVAFEVPVDAALHEMAEWARGRSFEQPYLDLLGRLRHLGWLQGSAVIHGEINEANAARRGDGCPVLLDWDNAGCGPTALEYGSPLVMRFVSLDDLQLDHAVAEAFYGAYLGAGGEVDPELAVDVGLYTALRYMRFAETERRWRRAWHAAEHRSELVAAVASIVSA
jgi:hypothetical protein